MAPFCPHHTAATRKPSHPNVTIDAIHRTKETEFDKVLRAHIAASPLLCLARAHRPSHIHVIRLSVRSAQVDANAMQPAPSSLPASITDTMAPATVSEDAAFDGFSSDEEPVWNTAVDAPTSEDGELFLMSEIPLYKEQLLEDTGTGSATHQASLGDQIARLGSQEMYWSPWESGLLQDGCWDSVRL